MQKFEDFGLSAEMLNALSKKGFEEPSEIQKLVLPELLKERTHLIGQAQTGTGKTAAFSIPILETIESDKTVKALILAGYGGASIENQSRRLKSGVDIVVGTPGRVIDLMNKKVLKVDNLDYFVLDEADEMLNMGFVEDIEEILKKTNDEKKMLFFSATIPKPILAIAKKFMPEYKLLKVAKKELTTNLTEQIYYEVKQEDKFEALCRVLDYEQDFYGIVFCRTKSEVDDVTNKLKARNYDAECIHGDITQALRQKALDLFKKKVLTILVATDVAARGIDVSNLTHVINYSIPQEAESYVHRIGRTGRAGKKGIAITFVTPREASKLAQIKRITKTDIKREDIPNVEEILNAKKEALIAYVEEIIKEDDHSAYDELANNLLQGRDPKQVLASVLRHVYEDEFLPENYSEIQDVKVKIADKTRLFIALGSKDGYNVGRLLDLLHKKAKTPGRKVKDVKIMDKYSFITVPLQEAEYIMRALNSKNDSKPLVEEATGGRKSGGSEKKSSSKKSGRKKSSSKKSSSKKDKKEKKEKKDKRDKKERKDKKDKKSKKKSKK